ncbi:MAG: NAD-dependent succinate-semialdehyde dehydrogenase [Bacteroidales bacterium]|nr:NAD-dependent succinate-semialdehyde dehydrogenase [Bacteroidales bacterium]MCF8389864.1 NAD-dependent succinate-semialdehyde dehydrogenase [Bacteroidales bacterium]
MANFKSINPFTGKVLGELAELSQEEIQFKLNKSSEVFQEYRKSDYSFRSERLFKAADLLKSETQEFAEIITNEMGKPITESVSEVLKCAWVCEYYAEKAEGFLKNREVPTDAGLSYVKYEPLGTILAVMPWNFPFWQVFRFAAPALMAGNTVLLKHASNVQYSAQKIEEIFLKAGFENGVFQNLAVKSEAVAAIIKSPVVKAITLTGSEFAGASVAEVAGRNIKKCVLELGGNNAFVVLKDADLSKAVDVALVARLLNAGQSCIAAKRFILEEEIHEEFISLLKEKIQDYKVGDPMQKDTKIGTLSSAQSSESLNIQVQKSIESGAILVCGGQREGAKFEPTILLNVKPGMPAFDEELFGPVFAVSKVKSMEEALQLSNKSEFGLGLNLFTSSKEKAQYFIDNAEEGAVFVNSMVKSDPRLPFGGLKKSGYGRELSEEGIREFVNVKTVYIGG